MEPAYLVDFRFAFDKMGTDGSAKCNVHPSGGDRVYGVIFSVPVDGPQILDGIEGPDYLRRECEVHGLHSGDARTAFFYQARTAAISIGKFPFDWYHAFVVHGAIMHGLPEHWVSLLKSVSTVCDPSDSGGARRYRDTGHKPDGASAI